MWVAFADVQAADVRASRRVLRAELAKAQAETDLAKVRAELAEAKLQRFRMVLCTRALLRECGADLVGPTWPEATAKAAERIRTWRPPDVDVSPVSVAEAQEWNALLLETATRP